MPSAQAPPAGSLRESLVAGFTRGQQPVLRALTSGRRGQPPRFPLINLPAA